MASGQVGPMEPSNNKDRRETVNQSGWRVTGDEHLEDFTNLPILTAANSKNEEKNLEPPLFWTEFSQSQIEYECEVETASNNPAKVMKLNSEEEECKIHPPDGSGDEHSNRFSITYSCSECCTEFKDQESLQNHFTDKDSKCFNNQEKSNVRLEKIVQKSKQINECWVCSEKFESKKNLRSHMRTHENEKPFPCVECGKRFGQKLDLKKHIRIHTGLKRSSCDECGQSFSKAFALKLHMTIHTGEKNYCCNECGKRFARKPYLKAHMVTHTGERPFSCDYCGKRYCHKVDLNKHMRIHAAVGFGFQGL